MTAYFHPCMRLTGAVVLLDFRVPVALVYCRHGSATRSSLARLSCLGPHSRIVANSQPAAMLQACLVVIGSVWRHSDVVRAELWPQGCCDDLLLPHVRRRASPPPPLIDHTAPAPSPHRRTAKRLKQRMLLSSERCIAGTGQSASPDNWTTSPPPSSASHRVTIDPKAFLLGHQQSATIG